MLRTPLKTINRADASAKDLLKTSSPSPRHEPTPSLSLTSSSSPPSARSLVLLLFSLLVLRKVFLGCMAMHFVWTHRSEVSEERIRLSTEFAAAVDWMKADAGTPFIFLLNRHALNMTLNWLCQTARLPDAHGRAVFVALDEDAADAIEDSWPDVRVHRLRVQALEEPFNYGDGRYQLLYLLRANLAVTLLKENVTFWMAQQDTYWRRSLSSLDLSPYEDADILFDRASDAKETFIAGGYYYARPTKGAITFFEELARDLTWWYAPDNAYMSALCRRRTETTRCSHLPFDVIPNWKWLFDHPNASGDLLPPLLQFDGETKLGGKLETMKTLGFYFLNETNTLHCNHTMSDDTRMISAQENGSSPSSARHFPLSFARLQFCFYQWLVDAMYSWGPTSFLLDHVFLPYAHFCMLTM